MSVIEKEFTIPATKDHKNLLSYLQSSFKDHISENQIPIRCVITESNNIEYFCEIELLDKTIDQENTITNDIFAFRQRTFERNEKFNAVLLIPTGIGADIGGHAGDAGSIARLLATSCDNLVLHPNVVNASDINEMPDNSMYIEGSIICRLLMGTIGLQKVHSNRVLVIIDKHEDSYFTDASINAVSAARSSYGFNCAGVELLNSPLEMKTLYSSSGRAIGKVSNLEEVYKILHKRRNEYDAVAFSSIIDTPHENHINYFEQAGDMVNPWGGVEAMLTHAVSYLFNVPSAHSPMLENKEIMNMESGLVEPRLAAEAVSFTFLQCILKGLQRSPKIITNVNDIDKPGIFNVSDISCLIIPNGCIGLPTLAALEQGIKVIAVKENTNLMKNDLATLPWASDQFYMVNNYLEATGLMNAIKAGLAIDTFHRPIAYTTLLN